ncbi:MAG: tetratricopeptide repeat protein, partial [Clostridiaceae bacterium]|nr:tetratricopeptide repeat protein [Clostridiaceae bacterium]
KAIEIQQKRLPDKHWRTALTKSGLGDCLTALERFQEAESLLLESYPLLKEKRGENDKFTLKALDRTIRLYKAWDKPNKVAEYKSLLPDSLKHN